MYCIYYKKYASMKTVILLVFSVWWMILLFFVPQPEKLESQQDKLINVDLPVRFVTFTLMGFSASFIIPLLFMVLRI